LIFEESAFKPFRLLWGPIFYVCSKYGEGILISGRDMPPKRNSIKKPWRRNSTSGSNFDAHPPSGTTMCVTLQNFSEIQQLAAKL